MFGANIFLLVVSVIELLLLFVAFQQGKGKWEGLWVILVECIAYAANAVSPDADHVTFRLENGMWIEWIRYSGWILTCPVLLMTLVSMTTAEGTKPPTVRLVPLLVANLTLVISGITSAASLPPVK
jgi:bacteriorhodopsin